MSGIARVTLSRDFRVNKQVYNIESDPPLSLNNVRVLKYDSTRNVLWAGTEGGGLNEIILELISQKQVYKFISLKVI